MTPVVDIISAVITAMKPTISSLSYTISGTTIRFSTTDKGILRRLFTYERVKVTAGDVVYYGYISVISVQSFEAVFASLPAGTMIITGATLVINFHHGHPLEIVNLLKQATHLESVKFEQFPAVCLFQDFPEKFVDAGEREAELNLVIVIDTVRTYEASQRYTYTFKPILYPLYDLFMSALAESGSISGTYFDHTKTDRLYWGKSGLYGNTGNLFNDFIDAIEIEKLRLKILKTC